MTTTVPTSIVDQLWRELQSARRADDHREVRRVENLLRELRGSTRFAHLTDAELEARLASLDRNRAPVGLLAYSPGGLDGDAGIADLPRLNRAIAANQRAGVEELRVELVAEQERRAAAA